VVSFSLTSKSRHPWENNNIYVISMAYFPLSQLEKNRGGGVDRVLTREIFVKYTDSQNPVIIHLHRDSYDV
jgi:hypothetical protein